MSYFTIKNVEELRVLLRESNIHDGRFTQAYYDQINKTFIAHIENIVWNDSLTLLFSQIRKFIAFSDFRWGMDETICYLFEVSGEKNLPEEIKDSDIRNNLCFACEMLSGNQVYIVCKELEVRDKGTVLSSPPEQTNKL